MSFDLVRTVFKRTDLPIGEKMVLLHLAHHHNPAGGCFPSQETLALECGLKVRAVRNHLTALERKGLVNKERRNGSFGQRIGTSYTFTDLSLPATDTGRTAHPTGKKEQVGGTGYSTAYRQNSVVPNGKKEQVYNDEPVIEPVIEPAIGPFENFVMHYPTGKGARTDEVQQEWMRATKTSDPKAILVGLAGALRQWRNTEVKYVPLAVNFLRKSLWEGFEPADLPVVQTWNGPDSLRAEILAAKGAGFVASYLDTATWSDANTILAKTQIAAKRLSQLQLECLMGVTIDTCVSSRQERIHGV